MFLQLLERPLHADNGSWIPRICSIRQRFPWTLYPLQSHTIILQCSLKRPSINSLRRKMSSTKAPPQCLGVAVLLFLLAAISFVEAAKRHESERRSLGRDPSSIAWRDSLGLGSIESLNVDRDFGNQTTLHFFCQNQSEPTIFKKFGSDLPRPQLSKMSQPNGLLQCGTANPFPILTSQ
jgi:hypothetical protein